MILALSVTLLPRGVRVPDLLTARLLFFLQHCTEGRSDIMLFAVGFLPHPLPLLKLIIKFDVRDKLFLGAEKL